MESSAVKNVLYFEHQYLLLLLYVLLYVLYNVYLRYMCITEQFWLNVAEFYIYIHVYIKY